MDDDWSLDCVVEESATAVRLTAAEMWAVGTAVERDIDGLWFPAVILEFQADSTFTIQFTDDDNLEEGVEVGELRRPTPDGGYEFLSPEVVREAASRLAPLVEPSTKASGCPKP